MRSWGARHSDVEGWCRDFKQGMKFQEEQD